MKTPPMMPPTAVNKALQRQDAEAIGEPVKPKGPRPGGRRGQFTLPKSVTKGKPAK